MRKQFAKAIQESQAALKIEPYSLIINTQLGVNFINAGELSKAVDQLRKTIEFDSTFAIAHTQLGVAYAGIKQFDKALLHLRKAAVFAPGNIRIMSTLGYVEGIGGKKEEAFRIEKELHEQAKKRYISSYDLAVAELGLGKNDQALQYLEQAFKERGPMMPFMSLNPIFSSLYENPGFQELVRKVEIPKK